MSNNVINNSFEDEKLENEACNKFENLINSFSTESHSDGEKAVQFPDEYGGAFYWSDYPQPVLEEVGAVQHSKTRFGSGSSCAGGTARLYSSFRKCGASCR